MFQKKIVPLHRQVKTKECIITWVYFKSSKLTLLVRHGGCGITGEYTSLILSLGRAGVLCVMPVITKGTATSSVAERTGVALASGINA